MTNSFAARSPATERRGPLGTVMRELYVPYPQPDASAVISCDYYYNIIPLTSGGVALPVGTVVPLTDEKGQGYDGLYPRCVVGRWDGARRDYRWSVSAPIMASTTLTGYLCEPWLAELRSGALLMDLRGTNGGPGWKRPGPWTNAPGRHWYALSRDGGRTWSEVRDWRYDTGESFHSPATMAKLLRHSRTGKLYWFGNISRGPTRGNLPRYPFYIAEVDEVTPAIRKETLTVIDDCDPRRDSAAVQFSNFFAFENRETAQFELYLSPYGQYGDAKNKVYQADVCKYAITPGRHRRPRRPAGCVIPRRFEELGVPIRCVGGRILLPPNGYTEEFRRRQKISLARFLASALS